MLAGRVLFGIWIDLPMDMPDCVATFLRWGLHLSHQDRLDNPDDMEVSSGTLYMVVSSLTGLLIVFGSHALIRRTRRPRPVG